MSQCILANDVRRQISMNIKHATINFIQNGPPKNKQFFIDKACDKYTPKAAKEDGLVAVR